MFEKKTLRLTWPQWQGGVNPNYVFGSELLAVIAPPSEKDECVTISVNQDFCVPMETVDGIDHGNALLVQMKAAQQILEEKQPTHLIVFGGDCSVTQVPFDYLSGKYGAKMGVLWLDAHPDCSSPKTTSHLHEMPLSNLLGLNPESSITKVCNPVSPGRVMLGGLIEEELREMDMTCKLLNLRIASPEKLRASVQPVLEWIKDCGIEYVAVHWDLDVLTPEDFRSIYPAEPYTRVEDFGSAVGRMTLQDVCTVLQAVSEQAEIVGLSITEHLPWDAFNLRKALNQISIFQP